MTLTEVYICDNDRKNASFFAFLPRNQHIPNRQQYARIYFQSTSSTSSDRLSYRKDGSSQQVDGFWRRVFLGLSLASSSIEIKSMSILQYSVTTCANIQAVIDLTDSPYLRAAFVVKQ